MTTGMSRRWNLIVAVLAAYGCGQKQEPKSATPVDPKVAVEAEFASGDYRKALQLLDACRTCEKPLLRAEILLAQGDSRQAEQVLQPVASAEPLRSILLAEVKTAEKDLPGALQLLSAAGTPQDPEGKARLLAVRAKALTRLSTPDKAEPALREALQAVSSQTLHRIEVGVLLDYAGLRERQGRWADALQFAKLAIRSAEQAGERSLTARSRLRLAEMLREMGDYEGSAREAQAAVEPLKSLGQKAGEAHALAARALNAAGNFGAAASQWEYALAASPDRSEYMQEAAAAAFDAGRLDRAEHWNQKAPTLTGAAILAAKEDPSALRAYQQFARSSKGSRDAWLGLAEVQRRGGDMVGAVNSCRLAVSKSDGWLKGDRAEACIHALAGTNTAEGMRAATGASLPVLQRAASQMDAHFLLFRTGIQRSHAWVVSTAGIRHHSLPGRSQLVSATGQAVIPILQTIPAGARVLITPEGPLVRFDFAGCRIRNDQPWRDEAVIAMLPDPSLLASPASNNSPAALVLAEPLDSDPAFARLERVADETRAVRAALPKALVLRGPDATPANWRRYQHVPLGVHHYAAPAEGNPRKPELSSVVLSPHYEGNRLYAADWISAGLKTQLVTLSAVRSALPVFDSADAAFAYASAALKAGAANVITCTGDRAVVPLFFEKFYQRISSGQPPIIAFQETQVELAKPHMPPPAGLNEIRIYTRLPRFR